MRLPQLIAIFVFAFTPIALQASSLATKAAAQDPSELSNTHFHFGAGISTFGPTFQLGYHYRPNRRGMNFRFLSSYSSDGSLGVSSNRNLDVMATKQIRVEPIRVIAGLGLSAVFVSARPDTYSGGLILQSKSVVTYMATSWLGFKPESNQTRFTVGLPVEVQLGWMISPRLSWVVHTFANVNTIRSQTGVITTLQWRLPRQ